MKTVKIVKFRSLKGKVSELRYIGENPMKVNTTIWIDMETGEPVNISTDRLNDKFEFHVTLEEAQAQAVRWHETQASILNNKINKNRINE